MLQQEKSMFLKPEARFLGRISKETSLDGWATLCNGHTTLHCAGLEPLVKEADDGEFLRLWRDFQTSDHLYYMFTAGGGPGEVHSYFSPFESPMDAFVAAQTLLNDFEARLRLAILTANEPFLFYTGVGKEFYTGTMAWSLKGFIKALKEVDAEAIEFHVGNGDFESWAQNSLKDARISVQVQRT